MNRPPSLSSESDIPGADGDAVYPDCHFTSRVVLVGGRSKLQLLEELKACGVELNDAARQLISSAAFTTSEACQSLVTVELAVLSLGFAQGATITEIHGRAAALGLGQPPIELGPHLRLQFADQPEGFWEHPSTQHRAPPGSITIASAPLSEDEDFPRGFYLRRIKGTLWLRGYRSGSEHIWNADDHFIFTRP